MRPLLIALMGIAMLATPSAGWSGPGPAGASVAVDLAVGDCMLAGTADPNASFQVRHEDVHGALKAAHRVTANGSGEWTVPCPGPRVATGDRLEFRTIGQSTPFRVFKVPALRLVTDRVRDLVTGKAPRVDSVDLRLLVCDPTLFGCTALPEDSVAVDQNTDGFRYESDQDLTGLWVVELRWSKAGDTVTLTQRVAVMVARLGSSRVTGFGQKPGQLVAVSFRRGQTVGTTAPITRSDASFAGVVRRGNGTAIKAKVGDLVSSSMAGDASMRIPAVSLEVTGSGATGTCFRNQTVTVRLRDATGAIQRTSLLLTDAARAWSLDATILAGWTVDVWCVNAQGDQVRLHAVAD